MKWIRSANFTPTSSDQMSMYFLGEIVDNMFNRRLALVCILKI